MNQTKNNKNLSIYYGGEPLHKRNKKNLPKDFNIKNPERIAPFLKKNSPCEGNSIPTLKHSPCADCPNQRECFIWGVAFADVEEKIKRKSTKYKEPDLSHLTTHELLEEIGERYDILKSRVNKKIDKTIAFNKACRNAIAFTFRDSEGNIEGAKFSNNILAGVNKGVLVGFRAFFHNISKEISKN